MAQDSPAEGTPPERPALGRREPGARIASPTARWPRYGPPSQRPRSTSGVRRSRTPKPAGPRGRPRLCRCAAATGYRPGPACAHTASPSSPASPYQA
jgi:hypothetical protein